MFDVNERLENVRGAMTMFVCEIVEHECCTLPSCTTSVSIHVLTISYGQFTKPPGPPALRTFRLLPNPETTVVSPGVQRHHDALPPSVSH